MGNTTSPRRSKAPIPQFEHYTRPSEDVFSVTNAYGAMSPWLAIHLAPPEPEEPPSGFRRESISSSFAKLRRASVIAAFERKEDKEKTEEEARVARDKERSRQTKSKSYLPSYMSVSPNGRMMFVQFSNHGGLFCFRIGDQDVEFIEESSLAICDSPHISWLVHGAYATLVSRCPQDLHETGVLESESAVYNEWKRRMDRRPFKAFSKADKKYCFQIRNITCTNMSESGVGPCTMITSQVPSNLFAYSESMRQLQIFRSRIRKGGDDFQTVLIEAENNTERSLDVEIHSSDMMMSYPHVMSQCPNLQWVFFQAGILQWRVTPRIFFRHAHEINMTTSRSRHNSGASSRRMSTSSTGGPTPFVNDCDPKVDVLFDPVDLYTYTRDGERVVCTIFDRGEIRDISVIEETENSCLISLIERRKIPGEASASWLTVGRIYREDNLLEKTSVEAIYEQLVSLKLHPFGGETLKCCWWTTRYLIFTLPDVTFASATSSYDDIEPRVTYDSDLSDSFCDLFALDVSTHSETQLNFMLDLLGDFIDQIRDIARIILNYSKNFIIQRCRLTTIVRTYQESQLDADALIQAHLRGGSRASESFNNSTSPPAFGPKEFTIRSIACDEFGQTLTVETHDGENAVFFVHYRPLGSREFAVDPLFDSYVHWGHLFADIESQAYLK